MSTSVKRSLVIRRNGIFLYTKRATWTFVWNCRWFWLPSVFRDEVYGGGWIHWGWFMFEKLAFDEWDDWGDERAEHLDDVLTMLKNNIDDRHEDSQRTT